MEERERMVRPLRDLIEIIQFTEHVSAKIHGVLDEAEIYRTVRDAFAQSKRYATTIMLLTDDESKLRIAETSTAPDKLKAAEKATGLRLTGYRIDVEKSNIYSQVTREGKTVQTSVGDILGELFPRPLARLITKTAGLENELSIVTPLQRHGKIIGTFAVTSTELAEPFIPAPRVRRSQTFGAGAGQSGDQRLPGDERGGQPDHQRSGGEGPDDALCD